MARRIDPRAQFSVKLQIRGVQNTKAPPFGAAPRRVKVLKVFDNLG